MPANVKMQTALVALAFALAGLPGCGLPASTSQDADCVPNDVIDTQPLSSPDRRHEDIIEAMTGERQTDDVPVEDQIDDPNFGGVWGDFHGGVVVAVLDCSKVDANQLARIAGGAEYLHLVEVPHTYWQVNNFRNALAAELDAFGVAGDIYINSTLTGRFIEVRVLDLEALPETFGDHIPDDAFTIVEVTGLTRPAG